MTEQEKKRQVAKISVFITSIFVIFLSISYAFINQTLTGTKRQVITSGNLELELKEGNAITLENALPMYDEVGMIQTPFEFKLINKTNVEANYTLKLVDITPNGTKKLDTSIVKYGLKKGEKKANIGFLSSLDSNIIDKGTILGSETINYGLRFWIDSGVKNENEIKNKNLSYRIDVSVEQENKISAEPGGTLKPINYDFDWGYGPRCEDAFCENRGLVTSVVFENKIDIPVTIADDKKMDISENHDGSVMLYLEELGTDATAYKMHIQGENGVYANPNSSFLFSTFSNLETIEGLEYFDTTKATNMSFMFFQCDSLQSLDLTHFNTSNVTDMSYMFFGYKGLTSLELDNFDTSNVVNMSSMFAIYSSSQPLDLSSFDTSSVADMSSMFNQYNGGLLTIKNWNNSKVTNMSHMFTEYSSSQPLNLSDFGTPNVTDMSFMFDWYSGGLLTIKNWNNSRVTDMSSMFDHYSSSQPLNLSDFNTSNVTNMSSMFDNYISTASLDISGFDFSKVSNSKNILDRHSNSYASPILVKDEAMKAWVLEQNPNLTNVTVKGA